MTNSIALKSESTLLSIASHRVSDIIAGTNSHSRGIRDTLAFRIKFRIWILTQASREVVLLKDNLGSNVIFVFEPVRR